MCWDIHYALKDGLRFGIQNTSEYPEMMLSIADITPENKDKIIEVLKFVSIHGKEIAIIHNANEAHFNEQFTPDSDLRVILASEFADEEDKNFARNELLYRSGIMQRPRKEPEKKRPPRHSEPGFVYLLKCGDYYKIGLTTSLDDRIKSLSTIPPFDIELICAIETDNMIVLEAELHKMFDAKRKNGEWFILSDGDVEYIKELSKKDNYA